MRKSNYTITQELMETEFCTYDQKRMIAKFGLRHDTDYLYLHFFGRPYRIHRSNGRVERGQDGFSSAIYASYNEAMSIYDYLCYSKEACCLSGRFCDVNSLKGTVYSASLGASFYQSYADLFDRRLPALKQALQILGSEMLPIGDLSCKLYPFDQFPIIFQFWQADEDFPAAIKILWDENTLDYMHYETTYFVVGHLMKYLEELISSIP